jgi:2-aminoadipate transaminase
MQTWKLDEHITEIKKVYKVRRDLMVDSIKKYFPEDIKFTYPLGGLFTWVELHEDIDAAELLKEALAKKVAFVPGESFFPNGGRANHFRLNYSNMCDEKIVEGIKRLGEVIKRHY